MTRIVEARLVITAEDRALEARRQLDLARDARERSPGLATNVQVAIAQLHFDQARKALARGE